MRVLIPLLVLTACSVHGQEPPAPPVALATPVRVAKVVVATLREIVKAPGRLVPMHQQEIRAPFDCVLVRLRVADGDRVTAGQVVAEVVSQNSEAALDGARAMLRAARTDPGRADARRALSIAEANLVRRALRAPASGLVASHQAAQGDILAAHQGILSVVDDGTLVLVADVPQSALPRVRPGQPVDVALTARSTALRGTVRAILPAGAALTAPIQVAIRHPPSPLDPGLFGFARVVVGAHAGALAVPAAAVLRDDVTGVSHVTTVEDGVAHRIEVRTGTRDRGLVEILSPALRPGTTVIVQGQVGLPDGARVRAGP